MRSTISNTRSICRLLAPPLDEDLHTQTRARALALITYTYIFVCPPICGREEFANFLQTLLEMQIDRKLTRRTYSCASQEPLMMLGIALCGGSLSRNTICAHIRGSSDKSDHRHSAQHSDTAPHGCSHLMFANVCEVAALISPVNAGQ